MVVETTTVPAGFDAAKEETDVTAVFQMTLPSILQANNVTWGSSKAGYRETCLFPSGVWDQNQGQGDSLDHSPSG